MGWDLTVAGSDWEHHTIFDGKCDRIRWGAVGAHVDQKGQNKRD